MLKHDRGMVMKTRDEVLKILREELPFLRKKYGVKRVGLFGSYSRDEATEESDIDILVDFERPIGFFGCRLYISVAGDEGVGLGFGGWG